MRSGILDIRIGVRICIRVALILSIVLRCLSRCCKGRAVRHLAAQRLKYSGIVQQAVQICTVVGAVIARFIPGIRVLLLTLQRHQLPIAFNQFYTTSAAYLIIDSISG